MKTTFDTTILGFGNNTGIEVPPANVAELGAGKKPPVNVTINGYHYPSTVAVMGGKFMFSLPKVHRDATGLKAGDSVTVTLELVEGIRPVTVPAELQAALDAATLNEVFAAKSYSARKEFCRQVADAKGDDTRARRIAKVIDVLSS